MLNCKSPICSIPNVTSSRIPIRLDGSTGNSENPNETALAQDDAELSYVTNWRYISQCSGVPSMQNRPRWQDCKHRMCNVHIDDLLCITELACHCERYFDCLFFANPRQMALTIPES